MRLLTALLTLLWLTACAAGQTIPSTQTVHVDDRTALLALPTARFADGDPVYLEESGREGIFRRETGDLSAEISPLSSTSTSVNDSTETITDSAHQLYPGDAVIVTTAVNGLSTNTVYYVIHVDADNYRLAATRAAALDGTPPVDLTGTTNFTARLHLDPRQGIYVTPSGDLLCASGCWVRNFNGPVWRSWFYDTADGADAWPSIQAAVAMSGRAAGAPGLAMIEAGDHVPSRTIWMSHPLAALEGEGDGDWVATGTTASIRAATRLRPTHITGPVIRMANYGQKLGRMQIDADGARAAEAYDVGGGSRNFGVWLESTDSGTGTERVQGFRLYDLQVVHQPDDGVAIVGTSASSVIERVTSDGHGGKGFSIDGGNRTGRTNKSRPGLISIYDSRATRNGGEALAIGHPDDDATSAPVRFYVQNFESFGNVNDASAAYEDYDAYLIGENLTVIDSAFDGRISDLTAEQHGAVYLAGRNIFLINTRLIESTQPVEVESGDPGFSTQHVIIDGLKASNTALTHTVAVLVDAAATGVIVRAGSLAEAEASALMTSGIVGGQAWVGGIEQPRTTAVSAHTTPAALTFTGGLNLVSNTTDANDVADLPVNAATDIGKVVKLYAVEAFELQSADTSATLNGVVIGATNEAAIAAGMLCDLTVVADNTWLSACIAADGTPTQIVPDAL